MYIISLLTAQIISEYLAVLVDKHRLKQKIDGKSIYSV